MSLSEPPAYTEPVSKGHMAQCRFCGVWFWLLRQHGDVKQPAWYYLEPGTIVPAEDHACLGSIVYEATHP